MSEKGKNNNKIAFDQEAINKLAGKKKGVPTQEIESGVVKEVLHNTMLQIPKSLFLEFKRNYLVKYDFQKLRNKSNEKSIRRRKN